jgi:hypothetical protein
VRGLSFVERRDQRLHDRDRAVVGASVAPGLERVSRRNVPVAELGGLVVVEGPVDAQADLGEVLPELEVGGRRDKRRP